MPFHGPSLAASAVGATSRFQLCAVICVFAKIKRSFNI